MVEIIITLLITSAALIFLYRNIKKKVSGKCDCSSCSSHCSKYNMK
ncbi:MAG: FeoB-associated Cys-rich membrane protein [Caloramator sp.]|nr:FeoB-associated Cys-rich membrane protein [Caloramator sp.]